MESIYLLSSGELKRKDNTLLFKTKKKDKIIPINIVRDIKIFGKITLNKDVIKFLAYKDILIHYFTFKGRYLGTFFPENDSRFGEVLIEQVKNYIDKSKRLEMAKRIVHGEFLALDYILEKYKEKTTYEKELYYKLLEQMQISENINQLMSIEGRMRKYYYTFFDQIIKNEIFRFEKRSKRPPLNEINATISFGNAIIYSEVLNSINQTKLDPRIGYLHTSNDRTNTLSLDIAEIFKPILIDDLIIELFSNRKFYKTDFENKNKGIYLNTEGREKYLFKIDEKLKQTKINKQEHKVMSNRVIIKREVQKIQSHIMGIKKYVPYQEVI
jgi:CRISPR-associated protein Cas1